MTSQLLGPSVDSQFFSYLTYQQHFSCLVASSSWNSCFSWFPGQCPPRRDLNGLSSTGVFLLEFQMSTCSGTQFSSPPTLTSLVNLSDLMTLNITHKLATPKFLSLTQTSALNWIYTSNSPTYTFIEQAPQTLQVDT